MKIKLIAPKMSLRPMDSEFKRRMSPPLSLLTLATILKKDHEVYIEDENIQPLTLEDSPELVGITVNIDTAKRAYKIASIYRERGIPTILGGIHVSANPDEASQHADSICVGEAEEIIEKIVEDAEKKVLKKIYTNTGSRNHNKDCVLDFSLLNLSEYLFTNVTYSSRGCPFKCDFCYNSSPYMRNGLRTRPIDIVISEITNFNTKHVFFIDDNFIGNPQYTMELLKRIKPLGLTFHAAVSANILHLPWLMDEMKESGCKSLFIGFESINDGSIKSVRKIQNNVSLYEKLIHELRARDIMINASLVFGFDNDLPSVFKNTLDWLVENKIETMTAHILTPYPGTVLFKKLKNENRIIDFDTNHYNTANVVFKPKNMSPEELYNGYLWIYKEFYSFKNILRRLPDKKMQRIPYLAFNFGYRKFGRITLLISKIIPMNCIGNFGRKISYCVD